MSGCDRTSGLWDVFWSGQDWDESSGTGCPVLSGCPVPGRSSGSRISFVALIQERE